MTRFAVFTEISCWNYSQLLRTWEWFEWLHLKN